MVAIVARVKGPAADIEGEPPAELAHSTMTGAPISIHNISSQKRAVRKMHKESAGADENVTFVFGSRKIELGLEQLSFLVLGTLMLMTLAYMLVRQAHDGESRRPRMSHSVEV
jgi:hypothetical protein